MPTQSQATQDTERKIKSLVEKMHVKIADPYRHFDGLKTIVVRQAYATHEIQVTLITVGRNIKI